jgi:hypothetical protein
MGMNPVTIQRSCSSSPRTRCARPCRIWSAMRPSRCPAPAVASDARTHSRAVSTGRSHPADVSRPSNPRVHSQGAISSLPQEQTSASRHEASTSIRCNGLVDTPRKWPTTSLTPPDVSAQNAHSGRSKSGHLTVEPPSISAGRRALIWPIYHVVSVPAIMGIHGTIASVPWIFMQSIVSPQCAHMPLGGRSGPRRAGRTNPPGARTSSAWKRDPDSQCRCAAHRR